MLVDQLANLRFDTYVTKLTCQLPPEIVRICPLGKEISLPDFENSEVEFTVAAYMTTGEAYAVKPYVVDQWMSDVLVV